MTQSFLECGVTQDEAGLIPVDALCNPQYLVALLGARHKLVG